MAYSADMRVRAVMMVEGGDYTQTEVAELFSVSLSTLEKWLKQYRRTGQVALQTQHCGRHRRLSSQQSVIERELVNQPDLTLDELCERVAQHSGLASSRSMMCREVNRLELWRKKDVPRQRTAHGRGATTTAGLS